MYHVELLPGGSNALTPGWTYVADRGFDPAKAALAPVKRKRGIRDPGRSDAMSSRETNAIVRHLAELDRENHRDVQIPIPVKQKDASGRASRGKVTSNVRRILQSQKTFRNYLDDEEAALALHTTAQRPGASSSKVVKAATTAAAASRRNSTPASLSLSLSSTPKPDPDPVATRKQTPIIAQDQTITPTPSVTDTDADADQQLIKSESDNDPLLRSYLPAAPSRRIMQMLLHEPPLTYNAARAGPPISAKAPRHFCCMCGYWGKIRCTRCPSRTCGLDCYKVHEDSRCGAFF